MFSCGAYGAAMITSRVGGVKSGREHAEKVVKVHSIDNLDVTFSI